MARKTPQKTETCLNCGTKLEEEFEFCPNCGQKNADSHYSFKKLISEFFENYFSLDSRFGRSVKPFFIKPGFLTTEFMDGRRVNYANPVRLYLIISLIHFFLFSLVPNPEDDNNSVISVGGLDKEIQDEKSDTIKNKPSILTDTGKVVDALDSIPETKSKWFPSGSEFARLYTLSLDKGMTAQEIEDSLRVESMPRVKRLITTQLIKLQTSDSESFSIYFRKNVPLLMFLLLPVYALIIKLFFRKHLYIQHLIHSVHLHSFTYVVLSILWIVAIILGGTPKYALPMSFVILCTYITISFKRNYQPSKTAAFFKMLITGTLYMFILMIGLLVEILISALTF
ncbi:MAG: DUF3667 domain-containing protein [Cyclobacteriaceae bacterium]